MDFIAFFGPTVSVPKLFHEFTVQFWCEHCQEIMTHGRQQRSTGCSKASPWWIQRDLLSFHFIYFLPVPREFHCWLMIRSGTQRAAFCSLRRVHRQMLQVCSSKWNGIQDSKTWFISSQLFILHLKWLKQRLTIKLRSDFKPCGFPNSVP